MQLTDVENRKCLVHQDVSALSLDGQLPASGLSEHWGLVIAHRHQFQDLFKKAGWSATTVTRGRRNVARMCLSSHSAVVHPLSEGAILSAQ